MRVSAAVLVVASVFYLMPGLVYVEGDFAGALVIKPRPMLQPTFGGGEEGAWARHYPGSPRPWFMRNDLIEVWRFDWEYGVPAWVTAYIWAYLFTILGWLAFGVAGAIQCVSAIRKRCERLDS